MQARTVFVALIAVALALTGLEAPVRAGGATTRELPEFPHRQTADWVNSPPLTSASLRGHAVLVEFWAFSCSNCLATLPWMQAIAHRYRNRGLTVVAVHTPELPHEHDRAALRGVITRLGIDYPVMIDEDYRFWNALENRYWPAFYLFDAKGRLVAMHAGELHLGEAGSAAFEQRISAAIP
ncbi:MAG: redoxin family protein [Steroidobacteraceae bacterium]